jgi:hypothetical protein
MGPRGGQTSAMQQVPTARAFLRRLHPWIGKAVHGRWTVRRSFYQSEMDMLLMALAAEDGRMSPALSLRVQGLLARLHREWFPARGAAIRPTRRSRRFPLVAGRGRALVQPAAEATAHRRPAEPLADQPKRLLRLLGLPRECTASQFLAAWRRFLKRNHPDLNPEQTPDELRRFAEAVGLWRRSPRALPHRA